METTQISASSWVPLTVGEKCHRQEKAKGIRDDTGNQVTGVDLETGAIDFTVPDIPRDAIDNDVSPRELTVARLTSA